MLRAIVAMLLVCAIQFTVARAAQGPIAPAKKPTLQQALAELKTPPDWFETTIVHWDVNRPWKDGRLEVRRLLAMDEQSVREAAKITWLYRQKGDIGDGHEWPMYLMMSGNYAWAAREYPAYLQKVAGTGATHGYLCYVACLAHFGEYSQAMKVLDQAMADLPPAPWRINNMANVHNQMGDVCAEMGDVPRATEHYNQAIRLYPTSDQPFGRHVLQRQINKIQTKIKLLNIRSLSLAELRDGTYVGRSLGYSDKEDLVVTVTIQAGKIADVRVKHQEKIDLNATRTVPASIVAKQGLNVDAVTGATVTSQAIIDGAYQALMQAGMK